MLYRKKAIRGNVLIAQKQFHTFDWLRSFATFRVCEFVMTMYDDRLSYPSISNFLVIGRQCSSRDHCVFEFSHFLRLWIFLLRIHYTLRVYYTLCVHDPVASERSAIHLDTFGRIYRDDQTANGYSDIWTIVGISPQCLRRCRFSVFHKVSLVYRRQFGSSFLKIRSVIRFDFYK